MRNSGLCALLFILYCVISSCTTYNILNLDDVNKVAGYESGKMPFRMPNTDLQAPMFSKKWQVYANTSFSNSVGTGAAVAITDHAFLASRINTFSKKKSLSNESLYMELGYEVEEYNTVTGLTTTVLKDTSSIVEFSREYEMQTGAFELGYGRYKVLKNDLRNEWSIGGGFGKLGTTYVFSVDDYPMNFNEQRKYQMLYLQDDFGWVIDNFEIITTGRFNSYYFSYRKFEMRYDLSHPEYQKTAFSLEGGLMVSGGFKFLKAFVQVVGTLPIASPEIEWNPFMIKGGIVMRVGK